MQLFKPVSNLMEAPGAVILPFDEDVYVGLWQGANATLRIDETGDVDYRRAPGADSAVAAHALSGQLERMGDERFGVRANGTGALYRMQSAPRHESSGWKMVFDGEELCRV